MNMNKVLAGVAISATVFGSIGVAAEFKPASVRSLGMGGSNVASTNGVDATYWNPAAYGFFAEDSADMKAMDNNGMADKNFGLGLEVGLGISLFGPIAENLNKLANLQAATGSTSAGLNATELQSFAKFSKTFGSLNPDVGGYNIQGGAAVEARVLNYGVGVRTAVDVNIGVAFDNQNVGMGSNLVNAFTANAALPFPVAGASATLDTAIIAGASPIQYFTAPQVTDLRAKLVLTAGVNGVDEAAAIVLAYDAAMAAAVVTGDPSVVGQEAVMAQTLLDLASAPGDAANNQTTIKTQGVAMSEVGFTYGYAIDESLSIGGVVKFLQADIFVNDIVAFGATNATNNNSAGAETKTGFGLDMGVMYRIPQWQFGLTVKNINAPSFEHSSGYLYELAPHAKIGAAWIPVDTFTLEVGYDLTENQGAVADSLSQYWNVGLEWDAWNVLAFRVGAFENIAQPDIGMVQTLGLGLNLWAARLDLAVAQSANTVLLDGSDVPTYALVSAALNIDF